MSNSVRSPMSAAYVFTVLVQPVSKIKQKAVQIKKIETS